MAKKPIRFWEIDFIKGVSIALMVFFHIILTLVYFGSVRVNIHSFWWFVTNRPVTISFMLLFGVSSRIMYTKYKNHKRYTRKDVLKKFFIRGIRILTLALAATIATKLFLASSAIDFGILHLFGISTFLLYPLMAIPQAILPIGVSAILLGIVVRNSTFPFSDLLWLGLPPDNYVSIDYFPLLPWFGVILIGVYLGDRLYRGCERRFSLPDYSRSSTAKAFCYLGKHSLLIYFIHIPLIFLILRFINMI